MRLVSLGRDSDTTAFQTASASKRRAEDGSIRQGAMKGRILAIPQGVAAPGAILLQGSLAEHDARDGVSDFAEGNKQTRCLFSLASRGWHHQTK